MRSHVGSQRERRTSRPRYRAKCQLIEGLAAGGVQLSSHDVAACFTSQVAFARLIFTTDVCHSHQHSWQLLLPCFAVASFDLFLRNHNFEAPAFAAAHRSVQRLSAGCPHGRLQWPAHQVVARDIFAASATLPQSLALHSLEPNTGVEQSPAVKLSLARNMSLQKGRRVLANRASAPGLRACQRSSKAASLAGPRHGYRGFSGSKQGVSFGSAHVQTLR